MILCYIKFLQYLKLRLYTPETLKIHKSCTCGQNFKNYIPLLGRNFIKILKYAFRNDFDLGNDPKRVVTPKLCPK